MGFFQGFYVVLVGMHTDVYCMWKIVLSKSENNISIFVSIYNLYVQDWSLKCE